MVDPPPVGAAAGPSAGPGPVEESRRLWRSAGELEARGDPSGYADALRGYVAFVEGHRRALEPAASEAAGNLDEAGMAFYRLAKADLALQSVEAGLVLAPGNASLQHHKALILLALNRNLDEVLPLLDNALTANPHDKAIWATRGDALRLVDRNADAAESYLQAQRLDATSSQYVDRALKLVPNHPEALRLKVELARAHGGDKSAVAAIDALLKEVPDDLALHCTKAEILAGLGETEAALAELHPLTSQAPAPRGPQLLQARILLKAGRTEAGLAAVRALTKAPEGEALEPAVLEVADLVEASGQDAGLALELRQAVATGDPRNLANLRALKELALRTQRLEAAAAACRAMLAVAPDHIEALRGIAEISLLEGKNDAAFAAFRDLLKAHPGAVPEARHAMEAAVGAGRSQDVLDFSQAVLAADPSDTAARRIRAEALTRSGDVAGALAEYDQWIATAPADIEPRLGAKQLLIQLGETGRLPEVYDELFRLDPTRTDIALERGNLMLARSYDAPEGSEERKAAARASLVSYERASTDGAARGASLLGIGRAARLLQDEERAIRAYGEFLALPGNDRRPEVRTELGHALRDVGRLTEAEAEYSRAILLGSEESELLWSEVEVLSQLNQEARAVRLVDLLLQREPKNPVFLRRKGQLLLKSGRRAEGLAALRVAVEGSGGDPHALFEVAEALRATGAYADAVGFYRQGLAADPKSRPARLALAETLLLAGQYPEAVPAIDALLKEDPNDPRAWRARADAYRALGRPPEVLYSLKAILLLEPHNGPALLEKARIHLERSEKREAFDCLSTLARAGGPEASDGTLWLQVGDLAAALGETEEAQRSYERAAQLDASHAPEIDLRRARLRLSAGRPDLALEVLDAGADPKVAPADRPLSALLLRAEILTALERPGDAQKVYEDVRRREPRSPVAIAGLARSLLDQGKHAEARALLREVLPQIGPQESVYLLLGEAESGLGQLDAAVEAVRKGVELLPKSTALWVRLAELDVAQERWGDAATSYAHALALDGQNIPWLLRAGYVAERLGHPHEALALYDRATQVGPASKEAWCQRGLALLLTGQPEEALPSFDRALALDSDYAAAKDGRRTALQRTRESQIERHGRDALLLEARIHRPLTKNDLFVTLHTPFDLLEPVLAAIGRPVKVDLQRLPEAELQDLESASYHLITAALERRPEGIERRGFTLADVAVLSPPNYPLDKVQRLFGYLQAVLEADLRPENLRLAPDVEELARRAIQLPEAQRTLFQLVRTLRVGIYKARLIQIVEGAGHSGHAPLPSLDLGRYTPEFRAAKEPEPAEGDRFFAPENVPAWDSTPTHTSTPAAAAPSRSGAGSHRTASASAPPHPTTVRCVGCGGLASLEHACGATLCRACLATFRTCPKCQQAIVPTALRDLDAGPTLHATEHPGAHPTSARAPKSAATAAGTHHAHPSETGGGHAEPAARAPTAPSADAARAARPPPVRIREVVAIPGRGALPSVTAGRGTTPATHVPARNDGPPAPEPPPPERPPRPAHRADEEPRL